MRAPLPLALTAFLGGIISFLLFRYLRIIPGLASGVILFFFLRNWFSSWFDTESAPSTYLFFQTLGAVSIVFLAGFLYAYLRQPLPPPSTPPEEMITLEGKVVSVPDMRRDRVRFLINTSDFGQVRVTTEKDSPVRYGDVVKLEGKLKEPRGFLNPGMTNYGDRLRRQGIFYRVWSRDVLVIKEGKSLWGAFFALRSALANQMEEDFTSDVASFLKAVILGYSDIDKDLRNSFNRSGTAHILAVSGTHLTLLSASLFLIFRLLILRLPAPLYLRLSQHVTATGLALLLSLPPLFFYTLISGARIPTIRSLIMILSFITAALLGRSKHWPSALALAAFAVLLWQPAAVFDISFQLTFVAVLSILLLSKWFIMREEDSETDQMGQDSEPGKIEQQSLKEKRFRYFSNSFSRHCSRYFKALIVVSIAAAIGTAPLVASYFHRVSLISPISNLLIMPLTGFLVVPLGLFHTLLMLFFGGSFLASVLQPLVSFFLAIVRFFGAIPYASTPVGAPLLWQIGLFYLALFLPFSPKYRAFALVVVVAFVSFAGTIGNGFELALLDVGEGESLYLRLPDQKNILIDTGGLRFYDIGSSVVAPFLLGQGVRNIDTVILTHSDFDHSGGLRSIADSLSIGEVWWNGYSSKKKSNKIEKLAEDLAGIPFHVVKRGDYLEGNGYRIEVLHPDESFSAKSKGTGKGKRKHKRYQSSNNNSLVLKLILNSRNFLLTGDIEKVAEDYLVNNEGTGLKSLLLKVPHHGGKSSATRDFLALVAPEIAIISAGKNNRFRHPHIETLKRLATTGARIYRTDRDGAVVIDKKDGRFRIRTYEDFRMKPWSVWQDEWRNFAVLLGFSS